MPVLLLERGCAKKIEKMARKDVRMKGRFEKTKKAFDANHADPKLDFKKHQSLKNIFKIKLLGQNDGKRLMLRPNSTKNTFLAYAILKHDQLDE